MNTVLYCSSYCVVMFTVFFLLSLLIVFHSSVLLDVVVFNVSFRFNLVCIAVTIQKYYR